MRLVIRPDPRRSLSDDEVEVPASCAEHFGVLQVMIAHHDDGDGDVCLEVPGCGVATVHHLVALAQLLDTNMWEEFSQYVAASVLGSSGVENDIELVELMQVADFTGCHAVATRLGQYLMGLIRSSNEDQLTGLGRPLSTSEKLEVLGEMPLIHRFSGR
jgi:hypothetical protein